MNAEDLRQVCRDHSTMMLYAWVMECRTRFLAAAALLEWQTPEIVALAGVGKKVRVDTWPLVAMYSMLCERYIDAFYDPQRQLMPTPGDAPDEKWMAYFMHSLKPTLVADGAVVRNMLRVVGGLPCRSREEAAQSLYQHCEEMTLPGCEPIWAPRAA